MPHDKVMCLTKVICCLIDANGWITGIFDKNSFLNSLVYDVEFSDGVLKQFSASVISKNILIQLDSDGH